MAMTSSGRRVQELNPAERIFLHTRDRFLLEGFQRISVDDIAADLAISKKTFYKVFPSKEQLVTRIIESLMNEVHTSLNSIMKSDLDFLRKFGQVMEFLGQVGSRLGKPFLRDIQQRLPHLWDRIEKFRRERILSNFSQLLDQGIEEGYVRSTIHRRVFLNSYLAAVEAIITPTFLMNESLSARDAIRSVLELFFHGALTPSAAGKLTRLQQRNPLNSRTNR